jgi:hypothetical protein
VRFSNVKGQAEEREYKFKKKDRCEKKENRWIVEQEEVED